MAALSDVLARLVTGSLRHHPVFRRLLATQVTLSFGQQFTALALPTVAILFLNAGPMEVGILAALPWISSPILGPVAGTLNDRFPRRPVMVAAEPMLAAVAMVDAGPFKGKSTSVTKIAGGYRLHGAKAMIPMAEMELRYMRQALAAAGGNKTQAARVLGLDRRSFYRRLARLEKQQGE